MMGGGAGSGKSSALLAAAVAQSANPRHRAAIFRRDFPSLRHIISASYALFLPMRGVYNKAEHTWRFPSGGTLEFSHLEDETAVYQHAGKEYSFLGFDELQQLPGDATDSRGQPINSAFSFLQTRLRAAVNSGLRLECRSTATPGGPGAQWVRAYFRIPDSGKSTDFVDRATGFRRAYFRSTYLDNPALSEEYGRQLADQPEALRRALLEGDWTAFLGQVFTEWRYDEHTCEPFEIEEGTMKISRGADDGFAQPAAVLWAAHDKVHDRLFIIDELFERSLTPEAMARAVREIDSFYGSEISGTIDAASFADTGMCGGSRASIMNSLGCRWRPAVKGPGSRIAGISAIHARLAPRSDGWPGLVVFRHCKNLIRAIRETTYAERGNPEDYADSADDHLTDALRYLLGHQEQRRFSRPRVRGLY